jgi:hypothetical protein
MYDIDSKTEGVVLQDTLKTPPDYTNAWVLTNPQYLARNKTSDKEQFDKYDTNDLYKCFMRSLSNPGIKGVCAQADAV